MKTLVLRILSAKLNPTFNLKFKRKPQALMHIAETFAKMLWTPRWKWCKFRFADNSKRYSILPEDRLCQKPNCQCNGIFAAFFSGELWLNVTNDAIVVQEMRNRMWWIKISQLIASFIQEPTKLYTQYKLQWSHGA